MNQGTGKKSPPAAEKKVDYHTLFGTLSEGCHILGYNGKYLYLNDAAGILHRRPAREVVGQTWTRCWPGVETTGLYAAVQRGLKERIPSRLRQTIAYPDGGVTGSFLFSIQPVPEGVLILSVDIGENPGEGDHFTSFIPPQPAAKARSNAEERARATEQKMAQKAIRDSELKYRLLAENILDVIWVMDVEANRFTYVSPSVERLRGYTAEEVLACDVPSSLTPASAKMVADSLPATIEELKQGIYRPHTNEVEQPCKDGSIIITETTTRFVVDPESGRLMVYGVSRDITARKQMEKDLRESEEKYRSLLESSSSVIATIDSEGRFHYANKVAALQLGMKPGEIEGRFMSELFPPEIAGRQLANIRKVIASDKSIMEEYPTVIRGKTRWYSNNIQPVHDRTGKAVLAMLNSQDITANKMAEQEVHRISRHYQALIEKAPDGYVLLNSEGKFNFISPAIKKLLGYSFEDLAPLDPEILTHPDDAKDVIDQIMRTFADASYSPTIEYRFRHKEGSWRWVESTFSNLLGDADIQALLINFRDITERKQTEAALKISEALFSGIFQSSPIAITISDPESGIWLEVNNAFVKLTGYPRRQAIGRSNSDLSLYKNPEDRNRIMSILKEKGRATNMEVEIIRRNGETATILVSAQLLELPGQPKLLMMCNDITDRKKAEAEVRMLNHELENRVLRRTAQLQAANRELEAFSYSVSHDLRAPLRSINGFAQILKEQYARNLDEEGKRYCSIIRESSIRMADLIDDLLAFSRLGRTNMVHTSVSMSTLVGDAVRDAREARPEKAFRVKVGQIPNAWGDQTMLRQVWVNLVENAFKYSSTREKPSISITYKEENGFAIYCIGDNGVGFDMNYRDKLFGVFQRLHSMKEFEGTGVGLAIVHRIVLRHGGRVWADGKPGKGASFCFSLPLEPVDR